MNRNEILNDIAAGLLKVSLDNKKYSEIIGRAALRVRIKVLELLLETKPNDTNEIQDRINLIADKLDDNEELKRSDNEYLKQWYKTDSSNIDGLDYEQILKEKINQISRRSGSIG